MGAKRSWWQKIQKHRRTIGVTAIVFIVVVVIALIIAVVLINGTGFNGYNKVSTVHTISGSSVGTVTRTEEYQPGKTLWDLLQLLGVLAVPIVVGFGAVWFTTQQTKASEKRNNQQRETELQIATDNQRETALQAYIDKMSELLLHEKLRDSAEDDEVRKIARVRTLTVLPGLDGNRKGSVIKFLYESGLIDKDKTIIDLFGADLAWADPGTILNGANLSNAFLTNAVTTQVVWNEGRIG